MSWSRRAGIALLLCSSGCSTLPAGAAEVCPVQRGQPLRQVDVFDGPPEELATLVPDEAGARSGYWELGYVYDAARIVTIRCKYAGGKALDVPLRDKVARCDYKIDAAKTLALDCH